MPSLTRLLGARQNPARVWMEENLPNLGIVQLAWKAAGAPALLPSCDRPNWGFHGAAIDYRIRYFFTHTPAADFVAAHGSGALEGPAHVENPHLFHERLAGEAPPSSYDQLAVGLEALVAAHPPQGELCADADAERQLARFCILLGVYEAAARGAPMWEPLAQLGDGRSADEQLALVEDPWVDDIVAVSDGFLDVGATLLERAFAAPDTIVANPVFTRPGVAADGDLLLDALLLEMKATKSPRPDRDWIYQLVGYLLLDHTGRYAIRQLGFYLARVPAVLVWDVEELLEALAGRPVDLADLRTGFAQAAGCRDLS